jgi:hypothetical protein
MTEVYRPVQTLCMQADAGAIYMGHVEPWAKRPFLLCRMLL